ncbi:hypothetical protein FRC02_001330 [Tulasnella sp. 418]|nr:hypothetical protein FRC02_001330 [Tulasnella sp. 418]
MTNFQTGHTANIDTGIPVNKPSLNTIADGSHLILYTEDEVGAYIYAYSFPSDLRPHFSLSPARAPQTLVRVDPTIQHSYRFNRSEVCENAWPAYTIIRSKWKDLGYVPKKEEEKDGLISVLSMSFVLAADPSGLNDYRCVSQRFLNPYEKTPAEPVKEEEEVEVEDDDDDDDDAATEIEDALANPQEQDVDPTSYSDPLSPSTPALNSGLLAQPVLSFPVSPAVGSHPFASPTTSAPHPLSHLLGQNQKRMQPMAKRTFHSCWDVKQEIMQGPSRNDLIAVGSGSSHAVWLASNLNNAFSEPELKLASFAPNADGLEGDCCGAEGGRIRTLKLPASLNARDISAVALDDASGILALSTIRSELWILDYAVRPSSSSGGSIWDVSVVEI